MQDGLRAVARLGTRALAFVVGLLVAGFLVGGAMAQADPKLVERGHQVYKREAQCQYCHGWHGAGDESEYGGIAPSLRATSLNRDEIILTVTCGRPGTNMPYHDRRAYSGTGKVDCYGMTADQLGDDMPPKAIKFLSDRDIGAVADYVLTVLKGKPEEPTLEECIAFWGSETRACDKYK